MYIITVEQFFCTETLINIFVYEELTFAMMFNHYFRSNRNSNADDDFGHLLVTN